MIPRPNVTWFPYQVYLELTPRYTLVYLVGILFMLSKENLVQGWNLLSDSNKKKVNFSNI